MSRESQTREPIVRLDATRSHTKPRSGDTFNLAMHNLDLLHGSNAVVARAQQELLTAGYRHVRRPGAALLSRPAMDRRRVSCVLRQFQARFSTPNLQVSPFSEISYSILQPFRGRIVKSGREGRPGVGGCVDSDGMRLKIPQYGSNCLEQYHVSFLSIVSVFLL